MKNNKAFTLIEMLVVISLIGILTALALVSFTSSQKQARDVTRKSDLKQYQTAIENYASKNEGLYPIYAASHTINSSTGLCADLEIGTCPIDPKDPDYVYQYISDALGTNYAFWATLESKVETYWVVCSNGKSKESANVPTSGVCPI